MIRVEHNGTEFSRDLSACEHLGDVIGACAREREDHVVTGVRVDGCDIPVDILDKLESFPIEDIPVIQV